MSLAGLLALFILVPLIELALLLKVSELLAWPGTIALVVVTGVTGVALARWQGTALLVKLRNELGQGRIPAPQVVDGVLILVAGALLVTPGLITDGVGFLLLIPAARTEIKRLLHRRLQQAVQRRGLNVTYDG